MPLRKAKALTPAEAFEKVKEVFEKVREKSVSDWEELKFRVRHELTT